MNFIKNKLKELLIISIIFFITFIIYTCLILFKVIKPNNELLRISTYIIGIIIFLLYGLISGLMEKTKGWFAGLSSGIFFLSSIFIINLFIGTPINTFFLGKYLSYLFISVTGGIIGVNIIKK